jgi:hypothetical protein
VPYTLSPRQQKLYVHSVDLWSPGGTLAASGAPSGPRVYTQAYSAVPCHFEIRPNIDEASVAGRVQTGMIFTYDILHVAELQPVTVGWIVVNQTLLPDGSHGMMWHRCWKVEGPTKATATSGGRRAGKQSFLCYLLVPLEVPTEITP